MTTPSLYCPACGEAESLDSQLHCDGCDITYPMLAGVPFLFPNPEQELGRWEARTHSEQQLLLKRQSECDASLSALDQSSAATQTTAARLTHLSHAYGAQLDCLAVLLEPLLQDRPGSDHPTYRALKTRGLQDTTTLFGYATNLFRDWVWGDAENTQALSMLQQVAPGAFGKTLVLGAGGGRLAWDLAGSETTEVAELTAVDINPFSTLAARQITHAGTAAGSGVKLWEFPLAPVQTKDTAIERTLRAEPRPTAAKLSFVLADARALPFGPESFDTVVTPWFTDVVQESPAATARRINRLLAPGGRWLNFGSVSFANADPAQCLLIEELCALVASNGFDEPSVIEERGPYLQSPHSRFSRNELLHAFAANKVRAISAAARDAAESENSVPVWISNPAKPVPTLELFQQQALATQVHAYLMSLIDGERSIKNIAQELEERRLMTAREAVPVIQDFLTKMLDGPAT